MSLPRSVGEILREHVTLQVECIDRKYLDAYVPGLHYQSGVAAFSRRHRGHPFAFSALMDPISKALWPRSTRLCRSRACPSSRSRRGSGRTT